MIVSLILQFLSESYEVMLSQSTTTTTTTSFHAHSVHYHSNTLQCSLIWILEILFCTIESIQSVKCSLLRFTMFLRGGGREIPIQNDEAACHIFQGSKNLFWYLFRCSASKASTGPLRTNLNMAGGNECLRILTSCE